MEPALSITWALVTISPVGSMTKPEPVLRRGSPGSSPEVSSFDGVARCTRTYTIAGCRRAARSARRSLTRASSGATAASELSRQSRGPLAVDGPEHPIANAISATRTTSAPRDRAIRILSFQLALGAERPLMRITEVYAATGLGGPTDAG